MLVLVVVVMMLVVVVKVVVLWMVLVDSPLAEAVKLAGTKYGTEVRARGKGHKLGGPIPPPSHVIEIA